MKKAEMSHERYFRGQGNVWRRTPYIVVSPTPRTGRQFFSGTRERLNRHNTSLLLRTVTCYMILARSARSHAPRTRFTRFSIDRLLVVSVVTESRAVFSPIEPAPPTFCRHRMERLFFRHVCFVTFVRRTRSFHYLGV